MAEQFDFKDPDVRQAYKNVFAQENGYDLNDPDVNGLLDKHLDALIPPLPEKGGISETVDQGIAGFAIEVPRMVGKAMQYTGQPGDALHDAGASLVNRADTAERQNQWLKPTVTKESGPIKKAFSEGARMVGPSLAIPAALGLGLSALPVSATTATLVASGLGVVPMALAQGQATLDKARAAGVPYDEAVKAARGTAFIEGAGEAVAGYAGLKFIGFGGRLLSKFGSAPAAEKATSAILKEISDTSFTPRFLKSLGQTLAAEIGTEIAQGSGQAEVERSYGIDNVSPYDAGKSVIGPTAAMTILLGPFGANASYQQAARNTTVNKLLNDPAADPEQRVAAARLVHDQLKEVDQEAARNWAANSTIAIAGDAPLALDRKYLAKPEAAMFGFEEKTKPAGPVARAAAKAPAAGGLVPPVAEEHIVQQQTDAGTNTQPVQDEQVPGWAGGGPVSQPVERDDNPLAAVPIQEVAPASPPEPVKDSGGLLDQLYTSKKKAQALINQAIKAKAVKPREYQVVAGDGGWVIQPVRKNEPAAATGKSAEMVKVDVGPIKDDPFAVDSAPAGYSNRDWEAFEQESAAYLQAKNAKKKEIETKAHEAATSPANDIPRPTEAMQKAGNYKKGHITLHGLDISIENPAGSKREGVDGSGKKWSQEMKHHYGYLKGSLGRDKDHVDVFLTEGVEDAGTIFVIDQVDPKTGKFDEHKVVIGPYDENGAHRAYLDNYEKGWQGSGAITEMDIAEFKEWVKDPAKTKKPASQVIQRAEAWDKKAKPEPPTTPEKQGPGEVLTHTQARKAIAGKTEKMNGVDPATFIEDGEEYQLANVPVDSFDFGEEGGITDGRYDSTVDMSLAKEYAKNPIKVPILANRARDGKWLVIDGGHRLTAAKLRGDKTISVLTRIPKITEQKAKPLEAPTTPATDRTQDNAEETASPGAGSSPLSFKPLSEKAILVVGDTEAHKDRLNKNGLRGLWMGKHKGWMFPKKREAEVRAALADLIGENVEQSRTMLNNVEQNDKTTGQNVNLERQNIEQAEAKANEIEPVGKDPVAPAADSGKKESRAADAQGGSGGVAPVLMEKTAIEDEISSISMDDLDGMFDAAEGKKTEKKADLPKEETVTFVTKSLQDGRETELTVPASPGKQSAADIAAKAAKAGAEGVGEAMSGLYELFGGASLKSFPGGIDKDTYLKAKPHFEAALTKFNEAGKSLAELVKFLVDNFGAKIRPYAKAWVEEKQGKWSVDNDAGNADNIIKEAANEPDTDAERGEKALDEVLPAEGQGSEGGREVRSGSAPDGVTGAEAEGATDQGRVPGLRGGRNNRTRNSAGKSGTRRRSGKLTKAAPESPVEAPASIPGANFVITEELRLGAGGEVEKFNDNLAAIRTLKSIEAENRRATAAEQRLLARYVGWGGLANSFRNLETKEFAKGWEKRGADLEALLSGDEINAARSSTRNAHYTSETIVRSMWKAAEQLGFRGGLILESSVGTGNFIGTIPEAVAGASKFFAVEQDSITARIAKHLYPQSTVIHSGFEKLPMPENAFDLAIGNPPFGRERLRFQFNAALNQSTIHNQFFRANMDALKPGGLQIMVVSRYFMDAKDGTNRQELAIDAELLGAIRLPDTAFSENARTDVVTDIVLLRKRAPEEANRIRDAIYKVPKGESSYDRRYREILIPSWVRTDTVQDAAGGEPIVVNSYFKENQRMMLGSLERTGSMRQAGDVTLRQNGDLQEALDKALANLPTVTGEEINAKRTKATEDRFKRLSESMQIFVDGHEVGGLSMRDGKLIRTIEVDTPEGGQEMRMQTITADSPWSSSLYLNKDGKWTMQVEVKDAAGKKLKKGRLVVRDEKAFESEADIPAHLKIGESRFSRLKQLVSIRDLRVKQMQLELSKASTAKEIDGNRTSLRTEYQAFVKEHGFINDPRNAAVIAEMPDEALVTSLEIDYRKEITPARAKANGIKAAPASAKEAAILHERTQFPYEPPSSAASPGDALAITLSEYGRVDMQRLAGLLGVDDSLAAEMVNAGQEQPLIFMNPETKAWETASTYLSGNVARKLQAARDAGMAENITALEGVQPDEWGSDAVTAIIGSTWIPTTDYEAFIASLTEQQVKISFSDITNSFAVVPVADTGNRAKMMEWGTDRRSAVKLVDDLLNSRQIKVTYQDDMGKTNVDQEATNIALLRAEAIRRQFREWIFDDADRRRRLTKINNDKFNTRITRQHDGSHLKLPGKVPDDIVKLRRGQINAIWRGISERFVLLDHVVGSGKTFVAIARAMERRRMGLSRKPMMVVPNHLTQQFAADVMRLYPGAKVLAADKKDFARKNRRRLFAKIAAGDWDIVVIGHSAMRKIAVSKETEERFLRDELLLALQAIKDAEKQAEEDGTAGKRFKPHNVKEAEALATRIQTRLDSLKGKKVDRLMTFEQLGVDDITIDEFHEFKNLFYSSRLTGVKGMGTKIGSQKAADLYIKLKVLRENHASSIVFMTGTPISNSAVEMYNIMRHLAAEELRDLGLEHFDAWRAQFVEVSTRFEANAAGDLKEVNRLGKTWSNAKSLMELYYSFADVVTQDDLKEWHKEDTGWQEFPVPKVKGGGRKAVVVKPSPAQMGILMDVISDYRGLQGITNIKERNAERLRLMDRARKVSLDARAVDPRMDTKEENGKLEVAADNITRLYKAWDQDKGTQLVFLDRSVEKSKGDDKIVKEFDELRAKFEQAVQSGDQEEAMSLQDRLDKFDRNEIEELRAAQAGGWNAYRQLKQNLIARGIPASEIKFIQEASTDQQKQEIFDAVNDGRIRVLIGSTPKMGAGTNVQERLVGLHHLDVTWKPSDIEQREGRIIRQGNTLLEKNGDKFEVEIMAYVTEKTVDQGMWDLNASKMSMINKVRKYDGSFTMDFSDEESISMAEIAAAASGDKNLLRRVELQREIDNLGILVRDRRKKNNRANDTIEMLNNRLAGLAARTEQMIADNAIAVPWHERTMKAAEGRSVTINGDKITDRTDANKTVFDEYAKYELEAKAAKKPKFSITIDGEVYHSKDKAIDAVAAEFGDGMPFLALVGENEHRSRTETAREIMAVLQGHSSQADKGRFDIGELFGRKLAGRCYLGPQRFSFYDEKVAPTWELLTVDQAGVVDEIGTVVDAAGIRKVLGETEKEYSSALRGGPEQYRKEEAADRKQYQQEIDASRTMLDKPFQEKEQLDKMVDEYEALTRQIASSGNAAFLENGGEGGAVVEQVNGVDLITALEGREQAGRAFILEDLVKAISRTKTFEAARDHIQRLGNMVYAEGARKLSDFAKTMSALLGAAWANFRQHVGQLFMAAKKAYQESPLGNERGAITIDHDLFQNKEQRNKADDQQPQPADEPADAFDDDLQEAAEGMIMSKQYQPDTGGPVWSSVLRMFSSPEHYFQNVPALKRYFDAVLKKETIKHEYNNAILGDNTDTYLIKTLDSLRKADRAEYDKLAAILKWSDQNQQGYIIRQDNQQEDTWQVIGPDGKSVDGYSGMPEKDAIEAMLTLGAEYVREKGLSEAGVNAWLTVRLALNRGFDIMAAQMRRIIQEARETKQEEPAVDLEARPKHWALRDENKNVAIAFFETQQEAAAAMADTKRYKSATDALHIVRRTKEEIAEDPKTEKVPLSVMMAMMGELRGTYMPRLRRPGAAVLIARKEGVNPIRENFDLHRTRRIGDKVEVVALPGSPMAKRANELKAKGYIIDLQKDESMSEDVFSAAKLVAATEAILEAGEDNAKGKGEKGRDAAYDAALVGIHNALNLSIANIFKGRGFRGSMISRNKALGVKVWEGYEQDPLKAVTQYARNIAGGIAKRDTAREMVLAITGRDISWSSFKKEHGEDATWEDYMAMVRGRRVDPQTQKNAYHDAMHHMEEFLRNEEVEDRIVGVMKGLASLKYMGFRVSSAAVNLTNLAMAVPATMSGIGKIPYHKTWGHIQRAAVKYGLHRTGKGSAADKAAFDEIHRLGWDDAQFNMEAARVLQSKLGHGWDRFMSLSMAMFGATERVNRATTIFAAYQGIRENNKDIGHDAAMELAKEVSDKAHGIYGKATLPYMVQGKGPGQMAMRSAYTFAKFSHNYLLTMLDLGFNKRDYLAASHMLLAPMAMAGVGSSVMAPLVMAIMKGLGVGGDDPEEELYAWADKAFGGGDWLRGGLFGLGGRGVNFEGSVGINLLNFPTTLKEILGAPVSVLTDEFDAIVHASKGHGLKAAEKALPTGIGNIIRAYRESSEGVTTRTGAPVFHGMVPLRNTASDAVLRFFSFNPARMAKIKDVQWSEKQVAAAYSERRRDIYDRYMAFFRQQKRTPKELGDLVRMVNEYNSRVRASGRLDLPIITGKSVLMNMRRSLKPSKVEQIRAVKEKMLR